MYSLPSWMAPGPEALTSIFYKSIKTHICLIVLVLYQKSYDWGMLPISLWRTTLILKTAHQGSTWFVSDYRQITLWNTDYKIPAKILTNRLQDLTSVVIGEHKTCGIRGRLIPTNAHEERSILEWCCEESEHIAMLQINLVGFWSCASRCTL